MDTMATNGLAPQIEAHEDRLQRVEVGVSDLRVKVAEVAVKQDLHHQILLTKIDSLVKVDSEVKDEVKHLKKQEKAKEGEGGKFEKLWELMPVKFVRKYALHALLPFLGAAGHILYTWWMKL